jgi:four helix bundle protein
VGDGAGVLSPVAEVLQRLPFRQIPGPDNNQYAEEVAALRSQNYDLKEGPPKLASSSLTITATHFHVSRILETWKSRRRGMFEHDHESRPCFFILYPFALILLQRLDNPIARLQLDCRGFLHRRSFRGFGNSRNLETCLTGMGVYRRWPFNGRDQVSGIQSVPAVGKPGDLPAGAVSGKRRSINAEQAQGENRNDESGKLKRKSMETENGRIKGDLNERTKQFALNIISLYSRLPKGSREAQVIGDQLLRSGTSVGAHVREAQRAKSNADFINKLQGAMQELEETIYWLELLEGARLCLSEQLEPLKDEADQLMAILVTIVRKTKSGIAQPTGKNES